MLSGADGDDANTTTTGAGDSAVRVDGDPFGNQPPMTPSNQLRSARNAVGIAGSGNWQGAVVVECLGDQTGGSFTLLDVVEVSIADGVASGTGTPATAWSNINQVVPLGGFYSGGYQLTSGTLNGYDNGRWACADLPVVNGDDQRRTRRAEHRHRRHLHHLRRGVGCRVDGAARVDH